MFSLFYKKDQYGSPRYLPGFRKTGFPYQNVPTQGLLQAAKLNTKCWSSGQFTSISININGKNSTPMA